MLGDDRLASKTDGTCDLHSYHFLIHSTITHLAGRKLIRLSECML